MTTKITNDQDTPHNYTVSEAGDIVGRLAAIDATLPYLEGVHRVGEIMIIVDATIPSYALELDGSTISRTTYADLYAVLGDRYGNGDGSTTFELPDYRGRMVRGTEIGFMGATDSNPDWASRTDRADGIATINRYPGTTQDHARINHVHGLARSSNNRTGGAGNVVTGSGSNHSLGTNGGNEDRPENANVFFCIVFEAHG